MMNLENNFSPLNKFIEREMIRTIQVLTVIDLAPEAPNSFRVEWIAHDQDKNTREIKQSQKFLSILTVVLSEKCVEVEYEDINPIGFTVIKYTVIKSLEEEG
jgi:type IV secretory pathway component VirB8